MVEEPVIKTKIKYKIINVLKKRILSVSDKNSDDVFYLNHMVKEVISI